MNWNFIEEIQGYYFWKYTDTDSREVYNVTTTKEPPTTTGGYYSYGYLLKVKGLLSGPTIDSILKEWANK